MIRSPLSISLRLGLLFAGIAAAVFVATGAYLYLTLSSQMSQRDDNDLLNKAVLIRQLLHGLPAEERLPAHLQEVLGRVIGQDGVLLRVADTNGQVLVDTAPIEMSTPVTGLVPTPIHRAPEAKDIASRVGSGGPTRSLSVLASVGGRNLEVTLRRLRSDRLAILRRYAFDLLGALTAGTLIATLLGFFAVRSGLGPLRGVVIQANTISAQKLNTRLAIDDVPAELRELCIAFNAMLNRLEDGVQRLSSFSADLAHDMRTPVNALMMQSQVALSRERTREEYQTLLASNLEEYERLSRMIENTLFLARADNAQLALNREMLDVQSEVAYILDYFDILAEDKGIAIELDDRNQGILFADPVLVRRALNNLISNAITHTPTGGEIHVLVREDDHWLELSVENTGPGISELDISHVFERYYRGDAARAYGNSTGLGLAIVRAIMTLHDGSAIVATAPNGRTKFSLRFPRVNY